MSSVAGPSQHRVIDPRVRHKFADAETTLYYALLRMSLEDSDGGKKRSAPLTDTDLAVQLAQEEAAAIADADLALAVSLSNGGEEHQGARPHTGPRTVNQPDSEVLDVEPDDDEELDDPAGSTDSLESRCIHSNGWLGSVVTPLVNWWCSAPAGGTKNTTEDSSQDNDSNQLEDLTGHKCEVCHDPIRGAEVRAPCGHYYDKACTLQLFEASTRDESLFPPRCCRRDIPLAKVRMFMSSAALTQFLEKTREYQTLKRVYCSNPRCSRFLGPQNETTNFFSGNFIECGCTTTTCARCKARVTPGVTHKCQADQGDDTVLALGARSQWARCPGCAQLIELKLGCYHITCLCKTEFCYVCRKKWRTCHCPIWDGDRLIATAEVRVDAELDVGFRAEPSQAPRAAPPQRRPPVQQLPPAPALNGEEQVRQLQSLSEVVRAVESAQHTPQGIVPVMPNGDVSGTGRDGLVREEVDHLRNNHECSHIKWKFRIAGGRCENCHNALPLFRCRDCKI